MYSTLANAIGGTTANALALVTPSGQQSLSVTVRNTSYKPLARVEEYEFTTQRDQVEINQLGDCLLYTSDAADE